MLKSFVLFLLVSTSALCQELKLSDEAIVFRTDYGDMVAVLYAEKAPKHTAQILKLAQAGLFNHVQFFRTEKGFVTQIENYDVRKDQLTDEQIKLVEKIPAEFNDIQHRRGILSMARFDDPNSAETSFSFLLGTAPHLDGQYTVFGEVIQNLEVLDVIENLPPKTAYINSAEVVNRADLVNLKIAPASSGGLKQFFSNSDIQLGILSLLSFLGIGLYLRFSQKP